jgi:hypothetical protein
MLNVALVPWMGVATGGGPPTDTLEVALAVQLAP